MQTRSAIGGGRRTRGACLCVVTVLAVAGLAPRTLAQQPPADITFTLSTADGRTTFRLGESILLILRIRASSGGRYQYHRLSFGPDYRSLPERFLVEPANQTDDTTARNRGMSLNGAGPYPVDPEATLEEYLNDHVRLLQPGQYRVVVETARFSTTDGEPVRLVSTPLMLEITPFDPDWAERLTREAVAALALGPPRYVNGRVTGEEDQRPYRAIRTLAHLGTEAATDALVAAFLRPRTVLTGSIEDALNTLPDQQRVLTRLEEAIRSPSQGVTVFHLLQVVRSAQAVGLNVKPSILPQAYDMLSAALPQKAGVAYAESLDTLLRRLTEMTDDQLNALIAVFPDVPERGRYLTFPDWRRVARPAFRRALEPMARSDDPFRDLALERLLELEPAAGRAIVLERLAVVDLPPGSFPPRTPDVLRFLDTGVLRGVVGGRTSYNEPARFLLRLPDETLPELDAALVSALEQGKPVDLLIARYASAAVRNRVRAAFETRAGAPCGHPLLLYFFRVEPEYAEARLARERATGAPGCTLPFTALEDVLMSPGLERAASADLSSDDPRVVRYAQVVLQHGGREPQSREALFDGLTLLEARRGPATPEDLEMGFARAILSARGWTPTAADMDRLDAQCVTDGCRNEVAWARRAQSAGAPIR